MSWFPPQRPGRFVEVYVSHLKGICLEWAVAAAEGHTSISNYTALWPKIQVDECEGKTWLMLRDTTNRTCEEWAPLTDWKLLGSFIDKYDMSFTRTTRDHAEMQWTAVAVGEELFRAHGPSRYTALLRAVVLMHSENREKGPEATVEVPLDLAEMSEVYIADHQLAKVYDSNVSEFIDLRKSQN